MPQGNPMPNGTVVDFTVNPPDFRRIPVASPAPYEPYYNGSLNNVSHFVSVPTSGGKAVVQYGWFPDNQMPQKAMSKYYMTINNTPNINRTLYLQFDGTTNFSNELIMLPPDATPTATSVPPTPTPAPSPLVGVESIGAIMIGAGLYILTKQKKN